MSKRIYISADYDNNNGDLNVVYMLKRWSEDNLHSVDFTDMAEVRTGSVSNYDDCRICDLKSEFNKQINASSGVIFIVGSNTANRKAGEKCDQAINPFCTNKCTPYKANANGLCSCKYNYLTGLLNLGDDSNVNPINSYSYLRHEFEQAKKKGKKILILYNSLYRNNNWLPGYMKGFEGFAHPFWTKDAWGNKIGNYRLIREFVNKC